MLGLSTIQTIIVAAGLAVVLAGGAILYVYHRGEAAGSSSVTSAVERKAVETIDKARKTKEQADEDVRRTPYDDRADGLR